MLDKERIIVITGAAGFIGSGVLRYLNDKGMENIALIDSLGTDDKWKNLVKKSFIDLVPIDQCFSWLKGRESQIQAILHLGACSSTVETNADFLYENNTNFSIKLAEYAAKHRHRFIYASSAATYGDGSKGFSDDHGDLEDLEPLNMYGYSKHLFDLWAKKNGLLNHIVGLKYFNVFGPNEQHKGRMASAVQHLLPQVLEKGRIQLFKSNDLKIKDGEQSRDFIYVKDAVRMTCAFLENNGSGIFNIGTGRAGTWNELAKAVFRAANKPVEIDYMDMPKDLLGKYQNYTRADMSKTAGLLGKDAFCDPLDVSVGDYVQNYLLTGEKW